MQASVTVPMAAQADEIWNIVADVRNTGKFSPEVMEAEWLDGATEPALGARFRGHVQANRDRSGLLDSLPRDSMRAG